MILPLLSLTNRVNKSGEIKSQKTQLVMKKLFLLLFLALSLSSYAQSEDYQLSTHILNISNGTPAPGVTVELYKYEEDDSDWEMVDSKKTQESGRINTFLEGSKHEGTYKLVFQTAEYFDQMGVESFYPFIPVVFEISDAAHYHVPITLSRYGYSTYRGS